LFVEPIALTAAECRGYNREVGMTGLGRPDWVCCGAAALNLYRNSKRVSKAVCVASRDVVEILNATLFDLGGRIRFPGESGCLRLLEERFASDECRQSQIITRSAQGLNDIDEDSEDSEATNKRLSIPRCNFNSQPHRPNQSNAFTYAIASF
jgi:hypothetical protein